VNFDWYGASVDAGVDETLAEVVGAFDMSSPFPARGMWGYERAVTVKRGDTVLATVMWDNRGDSSGESCYVQGTGRHAASVADLVRKWKPLHRVARADVAEDYAGEGAWDRLSGLSLKVADEFHIDVEHAGDHHRAVKGRSIYVGGRTSVVREICYEKGKQIGGDPNHVRVEVRVRPQGRDAKYRAGQLMPLEYYGASRWSKQLGVYLGQPEVARMSLGTVYRDEDVERSRKALLRQYGPILRGIRDEQGSWGAVGDWLGSQLGE
jgi:hypothetical protein